VSPLLQLSDPCRQEPLRLDIGEQERFRDKIWYN
jgi:hypothetical protein